MKIKQYGAGYIDEIKKPLIIDEQIALLNFSEASSHINSVIANKKQMGCMEFNLNEFLEILKNDNLKEMILIITLHWGYERIILPSEKQIELAHQLIDLGVDLVIGHHPHIIQPYEVYKGKYIFYSLGNYFFPNYYGYKSGIYYEWNKLNCYSIIITVEIQDNKKLNISFEGLEFNNKQFKLDFNPIGKTLLIKYSNLLARLNKKENYDSIFRKYLQKFYFSDKKSTLLSIIINFYSVFSLFKKNKYSFIHRIKRIISFKRIGYFLKLLSDKNNWFNYNQHAMIELIDKILNFSN